MNIFSKVLGIAVLVALPMVVASQTGVDGDAMLAGQEVSALTNDVSSNGSFSYSVPFELPAFRGLVPGVSLSYNSSNKAFGYERNLSGLGWSLTGFSMIELQMPGGGTPIYGSAQSNSINIFALDGEPLLACVDGAGNLTGNGGSYPSEYTTNNPSASCTAGGNFTSLREDYRKIVKFANSWEITNPDGTKYTYQNLSSLGATGTSTALAFISTARFLLTSITDVNGNTVALSYDIEPNANGYATRPATIIYGGDGAGNVEGYKVQFMYGDRGYDITYALGWNKLGKHSKLLEAVTVTLNGQPIRAYDMTYELTAETARHRLESVTEYASDFVYNANGNGILSGTTLPATTFQYAEEQFNYTKNWNSTRQWGPVRVNSYLTVADFDSDGIDEIYSPALRQQRFDNGHVSSIKYTLPEALVKFALDLENPEIMPTWTNSLPGIPMLIREDSNIYWSNRHSLGTTTAAGEVSSASGVPSNASLLIVNRLRIAGSVNTTTSNFELYDFSEHFANQSVGARLVNSTATSAGAANWTMTRPESMAGAVDRNAPLEMLVAQNSTASEKVFQVDSSGFTFLYNAEGRVAGRNILSLSDINGDGVSDIRRWWNQGGTVRQDIRFGLGHDGRFVTRPLPNLPTNTSSSTTTHYGDVNGDGILDKIFVARAGGGINSAIVALGGGDGNFYSSRAWSSNLPHLKRTNFGDAKTSIRDVNGDGLGDLIIHNGFSTPSAAWNVEPAPLTAYIFLSTGTSFVPVMALNSSGFTGISRYAGSGDFNGDGVLDAITQWTGGLEINYGRATDSNRAKTPNLMTQVHTGQGETIEINFGSTTVHTQQSAVVSSTGQFTMPGPGASAAGSPLHGAGSGSTQQLEEPSYARFSGVQQVVTKIVRRNGRSQDRIYEFSYGPSYWVPNLRRFSGFQWVETKLPRNAGPNDVYIHTQFRVDAAGLGQVDSVARIQVTPSGVRTVLTRETTIFEDASNISSSIVELPYRPQLVKTVSEVNVNNAGGWLTSRSRYVTNLYGQTTETVEQGYVGGLAADRYTCVAYTEDLTNYIVNTPSAKKVQNVACNSGGATPIVSEQYHYNPRGLLTSMQRANDNGGWVTLASKAYDTNGNALTETDANNNSTTHTYGGPGNMFRLTTANAKGHTTTTTWNEACQSPATVTDPNALKTTYGYDTFCREITQSHTSGAYKNTSYNLFGNAQGQYVEVTTPSPAGGNMSVQSYFDGFGKTYQTSTTGATNAEADRIVVNNEFYPRGQLMWSTQPRLDSDPLSGMPVSDPNKTWVYYDNQDRPTSTKFESGVETTTQYEVGANNTFIVRSRNALCNDNDPNTTCMESLSFTDGLGRETLTQASDWTGSDVGSGGGMRNTNYSYDLADRLIGITDPIGATWTYTYNALGQRTVSNDPDLGHWTYTFDLNGNVLSQTDARGDVTTFSYDALNRVVYTYANGVRQSTRHYDTIWHGGMYHKIGKLSHITLSTGITILYYYDAHNELSLQYTQSPNGVDTWADQYFRNVSGAVVRTRSRQFNWGNWGAPFPFDFTTTFDKAGRETRVRTTDNSTTYITNTTYNPAGQVTRRDFGNGTYVAYSYNGQGWLMSVYLFNPQNPPQSRELFHVLYTRDAAGRITTYNSSQPGQSYDYEYDYAGRLLFAHTMGTTNAAMAYTYDAGGNMRSNSEVGTYTYPGGLAPHPHTPTNAGNYALQYDNNGNMTHGLGNKVIAYDYNNRPTSVLNANVTTIYRYGPDGARQMKIVDGVETFYAGMAEIRDLGGANEQIILQPHADFRITDAGGAAEAVSYLHRDHLSSVRLITNAAGQVEQSTSYTPYGDPQTDNKITTTTPEEHSFIGERFDASTGLLYLNARYYDPALGRFMQPDWWEVRQAGVGTNRYSYSFNDPVNLSDRNGNNVVSGAIAIIRILLAASAGYEAGSQGAAIIAGDKSIGEAAGDLVLNLALDRATLGAGRIIRKIRSARYGSLAGRRATTNSLDARGIIRENESAEVLSNNGFHVVQNPNVPGTKNPDFLLDDVVYDNYAPSTSSAFSITDTINGKVRKGQTNNIVLNLTDSDVDLNDLVDQMRINAIDGVDNVLIVRNDEVFKLLWKE